MKKTKVRIGYPDSDIAVDRVPVKNASIFESIFYADTEKSANRIYNDSRHPSGFRPPTEARSGIDIIPSIPACTLCLSFYHEKSSVFSAASSLLQSFLLSDNAAYKQTPLDSSLAVCNKAIDIGDFMSRAADILNHGIKMHQRDDVREDLATLRSVHVEIESIVKQGVASSCQGFDTELNQIWADFEQQIKERIDTLLVGLSRASQTAIDKLMDDCGCLLPASIAPIMPDIIKMHHVSIILQKCRFGEVPNKESITNSNISRKLRDERFCQVFGGLKVDEFNSPFQKDAEKRTEGVFFGVPKGSSDIIARVVEGESPSSGSPRRKHCLNCTELNSQLADLKKKFSVLQLELDFNKITEDELSFLRQDKERLDCEVKELSTQLCFLTDKLEEMQSLVEELVAAKRLGEMQVETLAARLNSYQSASSILQEKFRSALLKLSSEAIKQTSDIDTHIENRLSAIERQVTSLRKLHGVVD